MKIIVRTFAGFEEILSEEIFQSFITDDPDVIWTYNDEATAIGTNTTGFNLYPSGLFRGNSTTLFGFSAVFWTSDLDLNQIPFKGYNTSIVFTETQYTLGGGISAPNWNGCSVRVIKE